MHLLPAVVWDFGGPQLSVLLYLHNIRKPGLGLQGRRGDLGGARAQEAEVLIDHLFALPAERAARPAPHTQGHEWGTTTPKFNISWSSSSIHTLLGCFFTPSPVL